MFDEVYRLQRLLDRESLLHEVIRRWRKAASVESRFFAQISLASWRAMRSLVGALRSQPYPRFHPLPVHRTPMRVKLHALAVSSLRYHPTSRSRWLLTEMRALSRIAADMRAVTLSLSESTMLGRIELDLHLLLAAAALWHEANERAHAGAGANFRSDFELPRLPRLN